MQLSISASHYVKSAVEDIMFRNHVRPLGAGGRLAYVTCSVAAHANERFVAKQLIDCALERSREHENIGVHEREQA